MKLRDTVRGWLTSAESIYLIGAGCSCCAGKPLIGELTKEVVPRLDGRIEDLFQLLKGTEGRDATIEDLMNHLLKRRDICASLKSHTDEFLKSQQIDETINQISRMIVKKIKDDWEPSDYYMRFLKSIQNTDSPSRDIFSLNYDTVFESSLEKLQFPYADGFIGAENAYFDPNGFQVDANRGMLFRLFKLHGSINWVRDENDFVRRRPANSIKDSHNPIVVYPSEQKYLQTQYGVCENLMNFFRSQLRSGVQTRLVCLGYSFSDYHINQAIIDSARQKDNNLSIFAFVGPEYYEGGDFTAHEAKFARIEAQIAAQCPGRFNCYVGNKFHRGDAVDKIQSEELLGLELWKFEEMVAFLAGKNQ